MGIIEQTGTDPVLVFSTHGPCCVLRVVRTRWTKFAAVFGTDLFSPCATLGALIRRPVPPVEYGVETVEQNGQKTQMFRYGEQEQDGEESARKERLRGVPMSQDMEQNQVSH